MLQLRNDEFVDENNVPSNLDTLMKSEVTKESRSKLTGGPDVPGLAGELLSSNLQTAKLGDKSSGSLLSVFNNLVLHTAEQAYDSGTERLLASVLDDLVNGPGYRAVMDGNTVHPVDNHSLEGNRILEAHLAYALRRLFTEQSPKSKESRYLERDIANLPEYSKENLRANLCYSGLMFKLLNCRGALLKSFANSGLDCKSDKEWNAIPKVDVVPNYFAATTEVDGMDDKPAKEYLVAVIGSIVSGSDSMQKGIDNSLKSLDDAPVWGDVYNGSIAEYRARNGVAPLAPLSMLANPLKNHPQVDGSKSGALMPHHRPGDVAFKYNSAVRVAHCTNQRANEFGAVKDLLDSYNAGATHDSSLSKDNYDVLVNEYVRLTRNQVEASVFRTMYGVPHVPVTGDLARPPTVVDQDGNPATLQSLVTLMEDSNQKKSQQFMGRQVGEEGDKEPINDRKKLRLVNIADLNIVPVNFHALRREVPLINLFNYSYTFYQLVDKLPPVMRKKIVRDPYGDMDAEWNDQDGSDNLLRLMNGALGNEMGRPKFLSDQLWNKALFRNLYKKYPIDMEPSTMKAGPIETQANEAYDQNTPLRGHIQSMNWVAGAVPDGKPRFDTRLCRNLFMFVCMHMIMRHEMQKELEKIDSPVVQKLQALNRRVTEFANREEVSKDAPYVKQD